MGFRSRVRLTTRFQPSAAGRWLARMTQRMIEHKTEALLAAFRERIAGATTGTGGEP